MSQRRNLWPLPGGVAAYPTTLRMLVAAVGTGGATRGELESVVRSLSSVTSETTARGYRSVPITLGLIEKTAKGFGLTTEGRRYKQTGDLAIIRHALVDRVVGVAELLDELAIAPATFPLLTTKLAERGISWNHPMAVRYRIWWLVATGAVESRRESRADILLITRAGERLIAPDKSPAARKSTR